MDLTRLQKLLSSDLTEKDSVICQFANAVELINWNETTRTILFKMTVTREFCNIGNFMNGGAIATLIDFATTSVVHAVDRTRMCISIDMDVNYVAMGKEDEVIFVEAICHKLGKSVATTTAKIFFSNGRVVAIGKQNFRLKERIPKGEEKLKEPQAKL
jgi:uncharacterized protein (TIGR00369 family)